VAEPTYNMGSPRRPTARSSSWSRTLPSQGRNQRFESATGYHSARGPRRPHFLSPFRLVNIEVLEHELSEARAEGSTVPAFTSRAGGLSMQDAYAIGARLLDRHIAQRWTRRGWKIGFTNQGLWKQLGLDQPMWAAIYEETVSASDELEVGSLVQPRIEPEIVLGFRSSLKPGASADQIAEAVAWAAPAFEMVECHFHEWAIRPADAVADAGLHAALRLGGETAVDRAAARALAGLDVTLFLNGRQAAVGKGSDVLGGPVEAVEWLLRTMPYGLTADDIVTTGTLTQAFPVLAGQTWTLRLEGSVALAGKELRLT
jgi:2-keto-4-pentenoate hydratase